MTCPTCGNQNADQARFCNNCGATLPVAPADADTVTSPPEDSPTLDLTTHDHLSGREIDGRYRIENLIGVGGMGSVYRATRVLIGDEVAIKILHTERVTDPHAAERFRREAQAAARLKHPNAVSVYDFGISADGLQYLVMELIEGQSLREVMKQQGALSPVMAAEVTSQVCAALDEAHRQNIVHRDIKPDNITLNSTPSGLRVKVLDFGIAKLRDDTASHLTQTGSVMGTPHYMSPEQCLGEELDARADIYSMGIVIYEMLCGRVPFNSPISTAVVVQHVNQPPPPLRSFDPDIPVQIETVVLRALEKRPDSRPQTATALGREMNRAVKATIGGSEPALIPTQPVVPPWSADETTLEAEQPRNKVELLPREMAPTVHLSGVPSGTVAPLPNRPTAASGSIPAATTTRTLASPYFFVPAMVIVLGLVIGLMLWMFPRQHPSASNSNSGNSAREATGPPANMAYIPGGDFMMGSSATVADPDSKPNHSVTVRPFYIDRHEVTCEQYKKFIDATGHPPPKTWVNGHYSAAESHKPVTGVSWQDADAYARWAGKRLPTEEEWEFAARGPKSLMYPWGDSWKPGCANADDEGESRKAVADVGSHKCGSPFGTSDMIGNAWEWTASDWVPYPGGRLLSPTKGGEKVLRGGSWQSPKIVSSSFRLGWVGPGDETGFRCAKDAP